MRRGIGGWKLRFAPAATNSTTLTRWMAERRQTVALVPMPRSTTIPRCCAAPSGWKPTSNIAPAAEALIKIKTGKEVKYKRKKAARPIFRAKSRRPTQVLGLLHSGSQAMGAEGTRLYPVLPAVHRGHQFHRHFYRECGKHHAVEHRRHASAVWPDSLPSGTLYPRQGQRWYGHRSLLQLRLGHSF